MRVSEWQDVLQQELISNICTNVHLFLFCGGEQARLVSIRILQHNDTSPPVDKPTWIQAHLEINGLCDDELAPTDSR